MKRLICMLCLASIFLAGCSFPGADSDAQQTKTGTPTSGYEIEVDRAISFTSTPTPAPTGTNTPQPSPTATPYPETATPPPPELPIPQPLVSGEPVTITKIRMFDTDTGWGSGYQSDSGAHILYTEDGGHTWDDRTPPDLVADDPAEIESAWANFLAPQTAWVIYAPQGALPPFQEMVIWRTADAGLSWEASQPLQMEGMEDYFSPEGFASVGDSFGWLLVHVGAGMSHDYSYLFATSDSGVTWERVADPYGVGIQSLHNTGIAFADPVYGWVSKDNLGVMPGAFFEATTDSGATWEDIFLPAPPELDWFNEPGLCETLAPTFTWNQVGMLIVKCMLYEDIQANTQRSLNFIYRTNDRGENWQHALLPSPVESLITLDEEHGWAFGRDYYWTEDGGLTWDLVKSVNWDGDFSFVDLDNGWAVARNEAEIALVVTEDGGQSWQIIEATIR